ncbi:rod shape-determining protein RodA [Bacteriovorax sp. Seq25_V]|uniref:rod shape-determining protein RodA n=1 Tax=Bacteriovorax sp. Seq25_V TaxID=1201288 RepID=UPI000389FD4F|nr:rod shape-determining protein RodA [Bacteriovorax sp. Seq25_V]EQC45429.1 rod shape-determining protein RodA [Bacteriovorax sp. Seq25_V]
MDASTIKDFFKRYDFSFFGIAIVIFLFGIINLYSATHASLNDHHANLYKVQLGWFFLSLVVGFAISFIQAKNFQRFSWAIYLFNVFLLVLVLFLGHQGMGARRWLLLGPIRVQPSELMKLSLVFILARWFSKNSPDQEMGIKELIAPLLLTLVPTVLTVLEPDLGTGLLLLLIFFIMAFFRKLKWKSLGIIALVGLISGAAMYQFGLKEYQRNRIKTFINPTADAKGTGYNAIQSKIAIGSGKFLGKGFRKSSQASLNYLPENHTDFVFSIYNEEHGFFGSILLIGLYLFLFYRFIWLSMNVPKIFDSVVIIGLMSIFFWHTFINMGMVMGLLPVVGLPLPLMSYGGSSLLTFGICCGVATSISNSRNMF